jgi:hypothetical protein
VESTHLATIGSGASARRSCLPWSQVGDVRSLSSVLDVELDELALLQGLQPLACAALMCTDTSSPRSGRMKPYPGWVEPLVPSAGLPPCPPHDWASAATGPTGHRRRQVGSDGPGTGPAAADMQEPRRRRDGRAHAQAPPADRQRNLPVGRRPARLVPALSPAAVGQPGRYQRPGSAGAAVPCPGAAAGAVPGGAGHGQPDPGGGGAVGCRAAQPHRRRRPGRLPGPGDIRSGCAAP